MKLSMTKGQKIELLFWMLGLGWLAFSNPTEHHFTFCPIKNLGFDFCLGCGLGHSISHIFHGNFKESWQSHPLGIFAIVLIIRRIVELIQKIKDKTTI
jgi:Protein of unknown function (DUF2752)